MVHIFGGRFRSGSSKSNLYGPEYLLTEDIVLVLPSFRVGILGFLSLEDISLNVPGNAALKDQNLALHWVQNNIKHFGGDPNNVTLVGHSSGASLVHYHLLSPRSVGLFQRAVVMSGSVFWTWAETRTFSFESFADVLNVKAQSEHDLLQYLRNLPAEDIIEAQEQYCEVSFRFLKI